MFHIEGFRIITITFLAVAAVVILQINTSHRFGCQKEYKLWLYISYFGASIFSQPQKSTLESETQIIAPVDGKIVIIQEVEELEYFQDKRLQVSIFMSPLNVHVTRYPATGKIKFSKYHPGKYLVAWHPKSSELNERTTIVIDHQTYGSILYRQIAGAVARRIVNYAKVGDVAIQGHDAGFIKFGSRIDLFLPPGTPLSVGLNERVKGGITIISAS